jgi:CheY-like chemotaxis protein
LKKDFSILLVEDDVDDVFFMSEALRRSGIDLPLHIASDGQEAIDFLLKAGEPSPVSDLAPPRLVLLDLNLPRKSGLEVLRWIRQESPNKSTLVVILTSSTSESDMEQAYRLGANSYVIKPPDATRLREFGRFLKEYWFGWNQFPPLSPRRRSEVAS